MTVMVPAATLAFWTLKILTTGMGETASDWLARNADAVLAVAGSGLVLVVLLLGASFADWIAVPPGRRGLDLGTGPITLVLIAAIVAGVTALSVRRRS